MAEKKVQPPPRRPIVADVQAMMRATNIDRRTCKRTVPLEVLCLGPSRTGTSSMRQALLDLGYHDVYHYTTVVQENPRDAEMWCEALEAKFHGKGKPFQKKDWDQLLGHCMAVTDTPCAMFYKELIAAYPEAKVVVTMRDSPAQWWQSQMNTIMAFFRECVLPPPTIWGRFMRLFAPPPTAHDRMAGLLLDSTPMYKALHHDMLNGTRTAETWYVNYIEEIKRIVPKENLLVMNVTQGWKPLCNFLNKDVPAWNFPKTNTTTEFEKNCERLYAIMRQVTMARMKKFFGLAGVMTAGIASASWWYWITSA